MSDGSKTDLCLITAIQAKLPENEDMIELNKWVNRTQFENKPWLIIGKGPTFSKLKEMDVSLYNTISLNHSVREQKVDLAHVIDIDVIEDLGNVLLNNCRFLLMPRFPHVSSRPCNYLSIEDWIKANPVLSALNSKDRLVVYDLALGKEDDQDGIPLIYFSSEAALGILGKLGAQKVHSVGVDGGRAYSTAFSDMEAKTKLANGQASFDLQFERLDSIAKKYGIEYRPIVPPMLVFVGADPSQMLAANVLAYSIHKHATCPVRVVPMCNLPVPTPKHEQNRARTGFSFYRFVIPELAHHRGRALYLDSDMLVFSDISELWNIDFGKQKVLCTTQPVPDAWKDYPGFHPGRQFSVMLLDCGRLPWKIDKIIQGLDEGRYTYEELMFKFCLIKPDEIEDRVPAEWNHLEHYEPGQTKLIHYTVIPTQPWTYDANPCGKLWEDALREALETGWITAAELEENLEKGYLRKSLAHFKDYASVESAVPKPKILLGTGHTARLQTLVNEHADLSDKYRELDKKHRHLEADSDNLLEKLNELKVLFEQKERELADTITTANRVQQAYKERVAELENDKHAIYTSSTWKLGRIITKPAALLKGKN